MKFEPLWMVWIEAGKLNLEKLDFDLIIVLEDVAADTFSLRAVE